MIKGIQNRSEQKIEARPQVDSGSSESLFDEFSRTLDKIAVKVFHGQEIADYPTRGPNAVKHAHKNEEPKPDPKTPEPKKSEQAILAHSENRPEHDAPHESNREEAHIKEPKQDKPEKITRENVEKSEKPEKPLEKPVKEQVSQSAVDSSTATDEATDEVSQDDVEIQIEDDVVIVDEGSSDDVESQLPSEEMPADDAAVSIAAAGVAPQQKIKDLEPVKENEEQGEGSEGEDPELPQPFSEQASKELAADTSAQQAPVEQQQSDAVKQGERSAAEITPTIKQDETNAEILENIADPNAVIEIPVQAAPRHPQEVAVLNPEQKVADAFAKVIQDMLQAEQNNQASQLLMKSLYAQPSEEAAAVLKRLYGAARLQDGIAGPNQPQAQGLQISNVGAFSKADSAQYGDGKASARPLPRSAEVRTMEKVENALKEIARSKDGKTISVRLDPPELGTVKIDVSYRDGGLHARLVAESAQVNNLLRDKTHEVVQMLRKLGINLEKVTVSVGSGGEQQSGGTANTFESFRQKEGGDTSNRGQSNGHRSNGAMTTAGRPSTQMINDDHWIA